VSWLSFAAMAVPPSRPWPSSLLSGCAVCCRMWRQQLLPLPGLCRLLGQETCTCLIPGFPQTLIAASLLMSMKWAFALHCLHHVLMQAATAAKEPPEPAAKSPFLPRKQGGPCAACGKCEGLLPNYPALLPQFHSQCFPVKIRRGSSKRE